ncbi:MAG TPA: DUF6596 domain-containing protein [Rhizomicrobium sp.]|nr:DUF6596 domain-containing protein [Rhizomicrobium sp.]
MSVRVEALVDDLFRREAGRMTAIVARIFGPSRLALAEDVVQDVLCRALETWKFQGVPENPSAWIVAAAKNRVIDILRREWTARKFSGIEPGDGVASEPDLDALFHPSAIRDGQLRMMFACCDPKLSEDARVGLVLQILCGFSTAEIAAAFLSTHAAVEKRATRAKKILGASKNLFALDRAQVASRLPDVQRALYLLFNEGYHGANPALAIRAELCREAMHLSDLLLEHPLARTGSTYGLAALMCLHAARLPARVDAAGAFVPMEFQDRAKWDRGLIAKGHALLAQSAHGWELSAYQIEAAIASVHASAARVEDTDWPAVVSLYDNLLRIAPSPVVALNRAIAAGQHEGPERGLAEIQAIAEQEDLQRYPFYWAARGEFALRAGRPADARPDFRKAEALARNPFERAHYARRGDACAISSSGARAGRRRP